MVLPLVRVVHRPRSPFSESIPHPQQRRHGKIWRCEFCRCSQVITHPNSDSLDDWSVRHSLIGIPSLMVVVCSHTMDDATFNYTSRPKMEHYCDAISASTIYGKLELESRRPSHMVYWWGWAMDKPESCSAVMFICINNFRFVALLTFTGYFWLYLGAGVHLHRSR